MNRVRRSQVTDDPDLIHGFARAGHVIAPSTAAPATASPAAEEDFPSLSGLLGFTLVTVQRLTRSGSLVLVMPS